MEGIVVHLSRLLWQKSYRVKVFGRCFPLRLLLLQESGTVYVELEAELHRARIKLGETSVTVLMVREIIQLKLAITDVEHRDGHLHRVCLEVKACLGDLGSRMLIRESVAFGVLDDLLICDALEVSPG